MVIAAVAGQIVPLCQILGCTDQQGLQIVWSGLHARQRVELAVATTVSEAGCIGVH